MGVVFGFEGNMSMHGCGCCIFLYSPTCCAIISPTNRGHDRYQKDETNNHEASKSENQFRSGGGVLRFLLVFYVRLLHYVTSLNK